MSEPIFTTDCVVIGSDPAGEIEATEADWVKRIYSFIGDTSFDVKVLQKSRWQLNCNVAEHYSKGRVFCLGDAVHRHTPGGGLRSNTSIQDSYNLAWKIAHVLKGKKLVSLSWPGCANVIAQASLDQRCWRHTRWRGSLLALLL
ncbi:hypothetical protein N7486_006722 [Penicillium sp. IBT 16267x]|nr:hypothetical protein N7486_006722 [Penicillium sp. IBT 16267x]